MYVCVAVCVAVRKPHCNTLQSVLQYVLQSYHTNECMCVCAYVFSAFVFAIVFASHTHTQGNACASVSMSCLLCLRLCLRHKHIHANMYTSSCKFASAQNTCIHVLMHKWYQVYTVAKRHRTPYFDRTFSNKRAV